MNMLEHRFISDWNVGDEVLGFYVLKTAVPKVTVAGKNYLNASVSDSSGVMEAKVWDYSGPIGTQDEGKVIKLKGVVSDFKGTLQLTIQQIRLASEEEYSAQDLVPTAPIDADMMLEDIKGLMDTLEDPDYKAIAKEMLKRNEELFKRIPAAKSVHHGFLHGLLMHTGNMLQVAEEVSRIYEDVVDRSLLLTGTLLHDFAKQREFCFSELGLVTEYSVEGELLGHLVLGAREVSEVAKELGIPEEKSILLQHLILSHHGLPEYGAAVKPVCLEAELLYNIDMMDSHIEIYREAMENTPRGEFSQRIFAMDKRIYNHN